MDDDNLRDWQHTRWLKWVCRLGWTAYAIMFVLAFLAVWVAAFFNPMVRVR